MRIHNTGFLAQGRSHGMEIVEHPTLAITVLFALRDLVNARQWTPAATSTVVSDASSPGGASDEPTPPGSSSLGDPPNTEAAAGPV